MMTQVIHQEAENLNNVTDTDRDPLTNINPLQTDQTCLATDSISSTVSSDSDSELDVVDREPPVVISDIHSLITTYEKKITRKRAKKCW